jgi:hypothetical protein
MIELLSINVWIIIMDVALLAVEYQNRHVIEQSLKGVVYSVKLKLEFAILNKLVAMVDSNARHAEPFGNEFITVCTTNKLESGGRTAELSSFDIKTAEREDISQIERAYSATGAHGRESLPSR